MLKTKQKTREEARERSRRNDAMILYVFVYMGSFCGISFMAVCPALTLHWLLAN